MAKKPTKQIKTKKLPGPGPVPEPFNRGAVKPWKPKRGCGK